MTTQSVQVKIELGHRANFRKKVSDGGFTHDWVAFVRGPEGSDLQHFVERVIFHLHDSFPKPKRVVEEPPYQVAESGYASFMLPIEIWFRSEEEPRKITFNYDLFLHEEGHPPVNHIRCEKLTFQNPTEEFQRKLIKAGGTMAENLKPEMYHRDWIKRELPPSSGERFKIVTYNLLEDTAIRKSHYEYCPSDRRYMSWRHGHIMTEIRTMAPDLVCYQEVQQNHWQRHLQPDMQRLGFDGIHFRREDDSGVAIFYRVEVFSLLGHSCEVFREILGNLIDRAELRKEVKCSLKKYIDHPQGMLLARLRHLPTGRDLSVAATHIIWKDLASPELQLMQIKATLEGLKSFLREEKSAYIVCGDFNTPPYYPGYSLLTDGRIDEQTNLRLRQLSFTGEEPKRHGLDQSIVDYLPCLLTQDLQVASAYRTVMGEEPLITNADDLSYLHRVLAVCLDYIWFSRETLDVTGVLQTPPSETVLKHVGLPSILFPSDHLPLQAEIEFK